jgi:hypothetical protein
VIEGGSLDTVFQTYLAPMGIEPLPQTLTKAVIGDAVKTMPRDIGEQGAWKALLDTAIPPFEYPDSFVFAP